MENILADDREHFFIAGLRFWPPQERLSERFRVLGTQPVTFGLSKPDLVEIVRKGEKVVWKVIDAKASKAVKVCHKLYDIRRCVISPRPPIMHRFISIHSV